MQCLQRKENAKSYSLVRRFWDRPVCILVLAPEDLCLEVLWTKFEEFCKPQTNEVRARFDLLTSFRQVDCSVDEWYNAVQAEVNLAEYPPETAKILHRDVFWFFLTDEAFGSKAINDSNIDLNKFPPSKVRQLAKKMESSKATAKYIKQVASEPQATQVHLMQHQCTELPPSKFQRKQKKPLSQGKLPTSTTRKSNKEKECHKHIEDGIMLTTLMQVKNNIQVKTGVTNVVTLHMWMDLDVQPVDINARTATCLVISVACFTRKKNLNTRESQENPEHTN